MRLPLVLGVVAGVLPSVFNHLGEFWKWSFLAKTASEYGFWVVFVTLIILYSVSRKLAVARSVLFCTAMMISYGIMESVLNASFINGFINYELAQLGWFGVIVLLVPVSAIIYDYSRARGSSLTAIGANVLVIAPLLMAVRTVMARLSTPLIVCADLSHHWSPGDCTFQRADTWIIANTIVEVAIYLAFTVFWVVRTRTMRAESKA